MLLGEAGKFKRVCSKTIRNTAKILAALLFFVSLFSMTGAAAAASGGLSVYTDINGEKTLIARYTIKELESLKQTKCYYSTIDASASPVTIAAQGITIADFLGVLAIPENDVTGVDFSSSDGWKRSFSTEDYLEAERYYYPQIINGYDMESTKPPEYLPESETEKTPVLPMLALRSYEGRFEDSPPDEKMTAQNGMRFCFGQKSITDTAYLNYGKFINEVTIILQKDTAFKPPEKPHGSGGSETEDKGYVPAEEEENGLRADALTISVGYFGGPYHAKRVFTLEELEAMPQVRQAYTFIDNMPSAVLDSAVGVRLTDIMSAAGIDVNSIEAFHFYCSDVTSSWYQSINKEYLLDTVRYYYPYLTERWDRDEGKAMAWATEGAVEVPTIIALKDNWKRFVTEENYDDLQDSTRFRLVFGQTDTETRTASRSAKWIHTIEVMLGGTPPDGIALDTSVLELEVGSTYTLTASLGIVDRTTDRRIEWSSSNPEAVSVDSSGRIRVTGEGEGVITATTVVGGLSASVLVNGEEETAETAEPGMDVTEVPPEAPESGGQPEANEKGPAVMEIISGGESVANETIVNNPYMPENPGGGVQNWRVFEMSETAVELPQIKIENPFLPFAGWAASLVLLMGMFSYAFIAYRER